MTSPPTPLNPSDPRPLYRRVESYIEALIHDGGIRPGDPIPSVSRLARTLGVNGLTVQRAIRELTFRRVLVTSQGKGTFVAEGAVKRVLWISGQNLFSGNVSGYHLDLYRYAAQECEKHRVMLEPVWLDAYRPFDFALSSNGGESAILGYLFSACIREHRLLRHVMAGDHPFVNISSTHHGKPRCVHPDFAQANRLAIGHLRSQGVSQIEVLAIQDDPIDAGVLPVRVTNVLTDLPRQSGIHRYEERGYLWARELMTGGTSLRETGLYVSDDVLARGVTRYLLEHHHESRHECHVAIRSSSEAIISLGMPVTYVVFDLEEMARRAVGMLLAQICGWETPLEYYAPYRLIVPEETPPRDPGLFGAASAPRRKTTREAINPGPSVSHQ